MDYIENKEDCMKATGIVRRIDDLVNDNMIRSHYHDYYELYFLDNGERYHYIDDKLYKTEAGDCIIFPPQTMHRSYSEQGCTFSRIVLYFRPDIISSDALRQKLAD